MNDVARWLQSWNSQPQWVSGSLHWLRGEISIDLLFLLLVNQSSIWARTSDISWLISCQYGWHTRVAEILEFSALAIASYNFLHEMPDLGKFSLRNAWFRKARWSRSPDTVHFRRRKAEENIFMQSRLHLGSRRRPSCQCWKNNIAKKFSPFPSITVKARPNTKKIK